MRALPDTCFTCSYIGRCMVSNYFCPAYYLYLNEAARVEVLEMSLLTKISEYRNIKSLKRTLKEGITYKEVGVRGSSSREQVLMPNFLNLSIILSIPKNKELICSYLFAQLSQFGINHLCATGEGGTQLLNAFISFYPSISGTIIKPDTLGPILTGAPIKNQEVVLLDDVIYTGSNLLHLLAGVRSLGGSSKHAIVLANRGDLGIKIVKNKGIEVSSLLNLDF
jgi:hypothetical protein